MLSLERQEHLRDRYRAMRPTYEHGLDRYRRLMDALVTPQTRILDVGTGPAGLVESYVDLAAQVTGIDLLLTNFTEFHGAFKVRDLSEADVIALPFADNSFDLVTCSWVLEHLPQPWIAMQEIARVLAPGGQFVFITPNALNYVVWLRRLVPGQLSRSVVKAIYGRDEDFINPTYYRMNTPNQVERWARLSGLQKVELHTVGDPTYLAFNEGLFIAAAILEHVLDAIWPQSRVHLVGSYVKPGATR